MNKYDKECDAIEAIIDQCGGIAGLMDRIACVCSTKADHIQANYAVDSNDDPLAKHWDEVHKISAARQILKQYL
jgi:hypothetical protein|tara:strand:+ start:4534 stop:4755 length:222 start_codon:yes stop_codon:yes gene_type:complete